MRRALVIATVAALAVARPETYKETEDFQYSRSSSDEGSKSGFYGAQRGNMGGNYERAHNMDLLAQHQMGGLVRTVDGDLGDGAKQKSGSVFSAANSRGVYGSGHYDLSNLQGRNFQEGTSYGNSQTHSSSSSHQAGYGSQSQSYSSAANSAYGSQSQNSRSHGYGYNAGSSDQALYANNMQSADNLQSASQYDGAQSSYGSGYDARSGYQAQSNYDQAAASQQGSNAYGTSSTRGSHYRLVGASPVRVYVRPGSTVTIPVAAQSYDVSHGSSALYDQNSQSSGSTINQNSINSEADLLHTDQQSAYKPTNGAKRYEASYSYRKQWEKHDTVTGSPLVLPTVNPYPANSELYEDTQAQGSEQHEASAQEARNVQSSSQYKGYNTKSASSRHQAAYNSLAQEQSSSSDAAAASRLASSSANSHRAYNYGASADSNSANLNSQVENFGATPKSYQSSYSYHKSWERQGDPYVIKPSTNGLYTLADSQASQRLTSSSSQASGYGSQRHGTHYHQGQQGYSYDPNCDCDESGHIRVARSNRVNQGQEYAGQQSQNLEDFGQQSQNLEDLHQQSQNLEDFGQLSQGFQEIGQASQNLEDFGQQSQNLEDLGQQSQNLEDLGQHSQNLEDLGQQSQNLEDFGQQSQNINNFGQESQNLENFGQESQKLEEFGQQTQDLGQQTQNQWDQQSQTDAGQQTQNTWNLLETAQHNHSGSDTEQKQSNDMGHTGFDIEHTGFDQGHTDQETQGIFEINHTTLNRPESHTTQEDKLNPFANTAFVEYRPVQEKTELGNGKEYPGDDMSRQPGQHDQFYWKPISPNTNENNQNIYVPIMPFDSDRVQQEVSNWHNIQSNTGYGYSHHTQYNTELNTGTYQTSYNYNPYTPNTGYGHPEDVHPVFPSNYGNNPDTQHPGNVYTDLGHSSWMVPTYNHNHNTNLQSSENVNSFTHTQTYATSYNHSTGSTNNVNFPQESGSTQQFGSPALSNLWDLIDDIEKQTISGKDTDNSYHNYQENTQNVQTSNSSDLTQNFINLYNSFNSEDKVQQSIAPLPSRPNIETTTAKQNDSRPHDVERGDIEPEKQKPEEEAGRGDIGPEDNDGPYAPNTPLEILGISSGSKPTLNKTPEDFETLSLTKENNKTTFVNAQSSAVDKEINIDDQSTQFGNELSVLSLHEQKTLEHHSEQDNWKLQSGFQQTTSTTPKSNYNYEHPKFNVVQETQQNANQNQGQNENIDLQQHESFHKQNVDHQNTDHGLVDFGQQSEGQEHQKFDQFEQHEGFEQENIGEHGQQRENVGQEQQKFDQFEQHEGFEQQNIGEHGQQRENVGQEQQKFDQFEQHEGFEQENIGEHGQQRENVGQEQQKFDQFEQHEGFEQESIGEHGQERENVGQEHQKFDQFEQHEGFEQENLDEHGQQRENVGQEQEKFNQFEQHEGFEQENIGEHGQQRENVGQEHQKFDQFEQHEGIELENLGDHGQQEHLGQESLTNFDQQTVNRNNPQKEQPQENRGQENEKLKQQKESEALKPDEQTFVPQSPPHTEPVVEPEFVTKKTNNVDTPPEPVTEKVGFWNKVGSKFVSAKDKVKSWFSHD